MAQRSKGDTTYVPARFDFRGRKVVGPERPEPIRMPGALGVAIAIGAIGVVGVGVYPAPWVALAQRIAATLFS